MTEPQNSPEERINQDSEEGQTSPPGAVEKKIAPLPRRISVLVNLGVETDFQASLLPSHIRFDDDGPSIICAALLIGSLEGGKASVVPGKPILVLDVPKEDAEWLPTLSDLGSWLSRMILILLRLCWFGKDEPRIEQFKQDRQSHVLCQVEGKPVSYVLKALPETFGTGAEWPWAVVTLEEPGGALVQLHIPSYDDEVTVKERCEAAMEGRIITASGHWYDSGVGRVFRVKKWARIVDPPAGSALEEIGEVL